MTEAKAADPTPIYEFRVSRLSYFVRSLLIFFASVGLAVFIQINAHASNVHVGDVQGLASLIWLLTSGILITLSVGRYHDIGKSGAWSLLLFLPLVSIFVWFYLVFEPSAEASQNAMEPRPTVA